MWGCYLDAASDGTVVVGMQDNKVTTRIDGPCATIVPQLEVLPLCSAFITHGGMGSVMESLLHHVPVVVIPVFGDQINNADRAHAACLGVGFRYPLRTLSAQALRDAVLEMVDERSDNPFLLAIDVAMSRMERTGGPGKAVDLILQAANGEH